MKKVCYLYPKRKDCYYWQGLDGMDYKEHIDYDIVASTNPAFAKAIVRVNVYKNHRQVSIPSAEKRQIWVFPTDKTLKPEISNLQIHPLYLTCPSPRLDKGLWSSSWSARRLPCIFPALVPAPNPPGAPALLLPALQLGYIVTINCDAVLHSDPQL